MVQVIESLTPQADAECDAKAIRAALNSKFDKSPGAWEILEKRMNRVYVSTEYHNRALKRTPIRVAVADLV